MAKVIKLTESQLKDIIGKVILQETLLNEQSYFTSKSAQEIWLSFQGFNVDRNAMLAGFQHIQSADDYNTGNAEIARFVKSCPNGYVDVLNKYLRYKDLAIANGIKAVLAKFNISLNFRTYGDNNQALEQYSLSITASKPTPAPTPDTAQGNTLPDVTVVGHRKKKDGGNVQTAHTPRQEKINNAYCSVKNDVIVNPASSYNNYKWSDYVSNEKVEQWEIDLAKKSCPQTDGGQGGGGTKHSTWVKNNGFPLKYGQYGDLIKQLQAAIGAQTNDSRVYDGYFGNKTEALVKMYYPTYTRETGVTQEMFNTMPKNPMDKYKFNTDINRFKTPPPAGGTPPPVQPAPGT